MPKSRSAKRTERIWVDQECGCVDSLTATPLYVVMIGLGNGCAWHAFCVIVELARLLVFVRCIRHPSRLDDHVGRSSSRGPGQI